MKIDRLLECLPAEAARLRETGVRGLSAKVPTCPDWTAADLLRHVAKVYLHTAERLRRDEGPGPALLDPTEEDVVALLNDALADLMGELTSRKPDEHAVTWYGPDQTVGFWIRRMTQETVVHRVDAELALGLRPTTIPADLGTDGVEEVLIPILSCLSKEFPAKFGDLFARCDGRAVAVEAGDERWVVRLTPSGVEVSPGEAAADTAARVSGTPGQVLLWLWRRAPDADVRLDGDPDLIATLRDLLGAATG